MGRKQLIKKIILIIIGISLIIIGVLFFNFMKLTVTGEVIGNSYSFTKAICNDTNFCQDYEIVCEGGQVVNMIPLSGAVVQHPSDWEDPRDEALRDALC